MSSTFLTGILVVHQLIVHVTLRPLCPVECVCDQTHVTSCTMSTLKEFPVDKPFSVGELIISTCHEGDINNLLIFGIYRQIGRISCEKLLLENNKQYSKCVYSSNSTPTNPTAVICNKLPNKPEKSSEECISYDCNIDNRRIRRAVKAGISTYTTQRTILGKDDNISNNSSDVSGMLRGRSRDRISIIIIGVISVIAVLVNVVVMVKLCIRKRTVIDLFAISLMMFNVLLSLYGIGMAFYLIYPFLRNQIYCQFFTSIKLFALGSGIYAVFLLIFHRSIENSIDIVADEKEIRRHQIFKSIAYVLQAVTLAGLLGVLSWIKLKNWNHLCVIITPVGTVDRILVFIELGYYTIAGLLVIWYLMELIYPRCKIFLKKQVNLIQAMFADEKRKEELLTPYLIREEAYIARDFPIFTIVGTSFCVWIVGYVITLPNYRWFDSSTSAVVRVCALIVPVILQPFLFLTMSRYNVRRFASKREKETRLSEVQMECKECTMFYTCPKCEKESEKNDDNMELIKMHLTKKQPTKDEPKKDRLEVKNDPSAENNGKSAKNNDTPVMNNNEDEAFPSVDESKELLSNHEERRKKLIKVPKIDISCPTPQPPPDHSPPPYMEEDEGGREGSKEREQLLS